MAINSHSVNKPYLLLSYPTPMPLIRSSVPRLVKRSPRVFVSKPTPDQLAVLKRYDFNIFMITAPAHKLQLIQERAALLAFFCGKLDKKDLPSGAASTLWNLSQPVDDRFTYGT